MAGGDGEPDRADRQLPVLPEGDEREVAAGQRRDDDRGERERPAERQERARKSRRAFVVDQKASSCHGISSGAEGRDLDRLGSGAGRGVGGGGEDDQDDTVLGTRVDADEVRELDRDLELLLRLSLRRLFNRFAEVDEAAGERPQVLAGIEAPLQQDDAVVGRGRDRRRDRLRVVVGAVAAVGAADRARVVDRRRCPQRGQKLAWSSAGLRLTAGASRRGGPRRAGGSRGARRCPGRAWRPGGRWWSGRAAWPRGARGARRFEARCLPRWCGTVATMVTNASSPASTTIATEASSSPAPSP